MTWTRQLALVLGGSTYAFTATLFVVLIGIALGSLIFHVFLRSVASSPWVPLSVIGVVIAGTLVGAWLLPSLAAAVGPIEVRNLRAGQFGNGLVCVAASAAVELVAAIGMGILFPLFVHLTHAGAARVGSAVGNIYAWNTLGSIIGASLTAAVLFPKIGTAGAAAVAVAMYVVSLLAVLPWQGVLNFTRVAAAATAGIAAVALVSRPNNPQLINSGFYLYGAEQKDLAGWLKQSHVLFFQEGASSNVLITRNSLDITAMRVNGKVDASDATDMATQLGLAYFPWLLNPDAKEVLVIGFGSGCTPGRCLQFPDAHVTCCELEPAAYAAAEFFGHVNGRPHELTLETLRAENLSLPPEQRRTADEIRAAARFKIVFGDGRTVLQGSRQKFDLIISEPSNPWIAGCSNLFTQEFFHAAREHLNERGVLAQWIQAYNFTLKDYLMIVRTMRREFPYYGVIPFAGGGDTLLLASQAPLVPDLDKLQRLQEFVDSTPMIRQDLQTWFGGTDLRWILMSNYLLGKDELDRLVDADKSQTVNTDLDLHLEFDAPLHLFRSLKPEENVQLALSRAKGNRWKGTLARALGLQPDSADFYRTLGDYAYGQATGHNNIAMPTNSAFMQSAKAWYEKAIAADPNDTVAKRSLRRVGLWLETRSDNEGKLRDIIRVEPNDALAHALLAALLASEKKHPEAAEHYRAALRLTPELSLSAGNYRWANNLAWLLSTSPESEVRNAEEAVRWARQACNVAKDGDPVTMDTLATALAEAGQFDEAIQVSRELIQRAGDRADLVEEVKKRIKLYESSRPYREE